MGERKKDVRRMEDADREVSGLKEIDNSKATALMAQSI